MRKLASIARVEEIIPIEDADNVELALIKGWRCVVAKSENWKPGDHGVYVEYDSIMPEKPEYEFLRKDKFRIKTKKIRGVLSQGLFLPLSVLPIDETSGYGDWREGDDVTEILGIIKYEAPEEKEGNNLHSGKAKGKFPEFLKKTDEERIQNCKYILEKYQDVEFYVTEKLEGSSWTGYNRFYDNYMGVCSRNLELKEDEGSDFWAVAKRLNIKEKMDKIVTDCAYDLCLQAEMIGPGIQGNIYKLKEKDLYFFNVAQLSSGFSYYNFAQFEEMILSMGLKTVPILDRNFRLPKTLDELLEYAQGKSVLNPEQEREGVVIRPKQEIWDSKLGRLSFKVISNHYLLKQK